MTDRMTDVTKDGAVRKTVLAEGGVDVPSLYSRCLGELLARGMLSMLCGLSVANAITAGRWSC